MPKRTNPFQALIYLIQSQLTEGATVTESEMLVDKDTGRLIEVDVVVRSKVGAIDVALGIECIDEARPASVEWVREMIGKHEALPIDKTILVSKSGFTKQAREKAEAQNAETLSLDDAKGTDWDKYLQSFQNLKIASFSFTPLSFSVEIEVPIEDNTEHEVSQNSQIFDGASSKWFNAGEYVVNGLQNPYVGELFMVKWLGRDAEQRKNKTDFTFTGDLPGGSTITDQYGNNLPLRRIIIRAEATIREAQVLLQPAEYKGRKIAHATIENIFDPEISNLEKVQVSITERGGKFDGAALLIPTKNKEKQRVILSKSIEIDSKNV